MAAAGDARIAVFGGTFNPPHRGHVACVRIALEEFGHLIDRVLVTPSNAAYYKGAADASAKDRLAMCRVAFAGMDRVEVSDLDIARGGITYTVDTMADVQAAHPEAGSPIFILGSDSYASLPKWKDADVLARRATFLVVPRVGVGPDGYWDGAADGESPDGEGGETAAVEGLAPIVPHPGFDTLIARRAAPAVSSTGLRERLARGESEIADVPPAVLCYIRSRNLYGSTEHMTDDPSVFNEAFYEALRRELLPRVGEWRYAHIIGVAETAKALAKVYGVDEDKAYLAGLLHDWDKAYDDDGIRARADELGLTIREDVYWGSPQTLHGVTAAAWFAREYPAIPADVLQAVARHTTGAPDMSPLDMVVFIADALEPGRHFSGLADLRALVGVEDLEELFISVEAYWISLIVQRKKTLHPDTFAVWNTYAVRHRERELARGKRFDGSGANGPGKPGDWSCKPPEALEE